MFGLGSVASEGGLDGVGGGGGRRAELEGDDGRAGSWREVKWHTEGSCKCCMD